MDSSPTNYAPTILDFLTSQSLMAELFGDEKHKASEITPSASKLVHESNSEIDFFGTQGLFAASIAQCQQTFPLPTSTFPTPSPPPSSLPYYCTEFHPQAPFYDAQPSDLSFESMMNFSFPPQATTTYQQPSYSYPPTEGGHPNYFYPTQHPTVYNCQPSLYQDEMSSSTLATPPPHDFYTHSHEQNNNELSLDLPAAWFSEAPVDFAQDSAPHHDHYLLDPLPAILSTAPVHFTQDSPSHQDYSTSRSISPTPSNETTDSSSPQSSATSNPRERTRRPRYVPRISRTKRSLTHGVFCDVVFQCEWESCGTVYQLELEGNTNAGETAFQNRVLKHLSEHAFLASRAPEPRRLQCGWGGCHHQMSSTTKECGMVRHLQSHIAAWYYFCPNVRCSHTSSRKVLKSHSNFCATTRHQKTKASQ